MPHLAPPFRAPHVRGSVPPVLRPPPRIQVSPGLSSRAALLGLAALLLVSGWLVAGFDGAVVALAAAALGLVYGHAAPDAALRAMGARPVGWREAPELVGLLADLSRRAGLGSVPRLHVIPRPGLVAFAAGEDGRAAVALSSGLLETLGPREVAAVMAHELSHIRAGDARLMRVAAVVTATLRTLSAAGLALALLVAPVPGLPLLALAPLAGDLLWLRLSRDREYAADAGAARLTGDPAALARALGVLSRVQGESWEAQSRAPLLLRWLRTHPFTSERIRRLAGMANPWT
jgi:heat shock protein HtpX